LAVALSTAPDRSQPMFKKYGGMQLTMRQAIGPTYWMPVLHCP